MSLFTLFFFLTEDTRNFKIIYVASVIFLLDTAAIGSMNIKYRQDLIN